MSAGENRLDPSRRAVRVSKRTSITTSCVCTGTWVDVTPSTDAVVAVWAGLEPTSAATVVLP
eukprot:3783484-Rhodomonas_salina.1